MGQQQVKKAPKTNKLKKKTKILCESPEICVVLLGPGEVGNNFFSF